MAPERSRHNDPISQRLRFVTFDPLYSTKENGHKDPLATTINSPKKHRGSWTSEKKLALIQAYANVFPPDSPKGSHADAWKRVVDSVNSQAPNDVPLGCDACRRTIKKLVKKTVDNYREKLTNQPTFSPSNMTEFEKAALTVLEKTEAYRERKNKKDKNDWVNKILCEYRGNENMQQQECHDPDPDHVQQSNSNPRVSADPSEDSYMINSAESSFDDSSTSRNSPEDIYSLEKEYAVAKRQYQDRMMSFMRNQEKSFVNIENILQEILKELRNKK
ncbi:hypothetical protein CLU79DRAFT_718904 [Phycomyces nitens]|nr:hypothetical protein CLU79DRAFT_718904 [Phycomyces nitens]